MQGARSPLAGERLELVMIQAGIGGAVVFAFVIVLLANVEFWGRIAGVAIVGFVVGAVCFMYGRSR